MYIYIYIYIYIYMDISIHEARDVGMFVSSFRPKEHSRSVEARLYKGLYPKMDLKATSLYPKMDLWHLRKYL